MEGKSINKPATKLSRFLFELEVEFWAATQSLFLSMLSCSMLKSGVLNDGTLALPEMTDGRVKSELLSVVLWVAASEEAAGAPETV